MKIDLSLAMGTEAILRSSRLFGGEVSAPAHPDLDYLTFILGILGQAIGVAIGVVTLYFLFRRFCINNNINNNGANANAAVHADLNIEMRQDLNIEVPRDLNIEILRASEHAAEADEENQLDPM